MNTQLLDELRHLTDACFHPGIGAERIATLERDHAIVLPSDHRAVLQESNGVEVYAGHIRLFGVHSTENIDAIVWNHPDCWKFAWGDRCSAYWCFGETAWGDQYAYKLESLRQGGAMDVYFLDALSMAQELVASCFTEFLETEFVRSAKDPHDVLIKQARQKLGPLEATSHLVYVPPVLLCGTEDIEHVQQMSARSAMIWNGDIAIQLDTGPSDKGVAALQTYEDESHRLRIRLVWE